MRLTPEERELGRLSSRRVEVATTAFDLTGFVFVEEAVPAGAVAACRAAVQADLADPDHRRTEFPGVAGIGATFFDFSGPFAAPEVVANPVLLQLLEAILGPDFTCAVYNTNVSKPGTSLDQPVHVDTPTFYDDGEPFSPHVSVHVTLCDFNEDNGSTEIWPGTHRHATRKDDDLSELAAELPSVRANLPAGSLMLRNACTWHRGRVNRTAVSREMLSMFFAASGSRAKGGVYERPLMISREVLESLPERARRVWAVNEVVDA